MTWTPYRVRAKRATTQRRRYLGNSTGSRKMGTMNKGKTSINNWKRRVEKLFLVGVGLSI